MMLHVLVLKNRPAHMDFSCNQAATTFAHLQMKLFMENQKHLCDSTLIACLQASQKVLTKNVMVFLPSSKCAHLFTEQSAFHELIQVAAETLAIF